MAASAVQEPSQLHAVFPNGKNPVFGQHKPHDVEAEILYMKDADDGTTPEIKDIADLNPKFLETRQVTVKDVRGSEKDCTLEGNGFEFMHHSTSMKDFANEKMVTAEHYPEMEQFIKKATGASTVLVFNHIVRNAPRTEHVTPKGYKGPATRPHVDISPVYAPDMLKEKYPDKAEEIMQRRWQVLNLWRPIKTVYRDPLAISDATTVPESDLATCSYQAEEGKATVKVLFTKGGRQGMHRWYYLNEQRPEELLVFKTYDSDEGAKVRMVPHTSFAALGAEGMPTRESIEMRCFVVY